MHRSLVFSFLSLVSLISSIKAQETVLANNGILVQFDAQNKPFIQIQVNKGQSMYGIRSKYGIRESELSLFNPSIMANKIAIGQWINVPIEHLMSYNTNSKEISKYRPLYYKVQPKEGILSLTRSKTAWNLKTLKEQNALKQDQLYLDQLIKIGFLLELGTDQEIRQSEAEGLKLTNSNGLKIEKSTQSVSVNAHILEDYKFETRGVAFCPNIDATDGKMFALHNKAKRGSYIEVYNPVLERSILAKVIGKIPGNYEKDVQVVVSKEVASALGALSAKFFVYVRQ
ncbi:MAG: LysM peptidoglycan-binding domain-containing protein [Saprospiraceae bacterium]